MKKTQPNNLLVFLAVASSWLWYTSYLMAQPIPIGNSTDTLNNMPDSTAWTVLFYKPANYDSVNSPIIWAVHESGGCAGYCTRTMLQSMAERRNALIVSPNYNNYYYPGALSFSTIGPGSVVWLPKVFKEIYKYITKKENRDSIPVHLIGFSAGGQCVTRYMLIRQGIPDSIPIKMAISTNPYSYTFCTYELGGEIMYYICGLESLGSFDMSFLCEEDIQQYYNENYTVLIGTADTTGAPPTSNCMAPQGSNRYERAVNFYAFSQNDAINRGTTLKWQYREIPGVGHNSDLMYNTKANVNDSSTIAESLLFDSPYHSPVFFPPDAEMLVNVSESICNQVSFSLEYCSDNPKPHTLQWDFGNGDTSIQSNPTYQYADTGHYQVSLMIKASGGTDTITQMVAVNKHIPPQADFSVDTNFFYLPEAIVHFQNNSVAADSFFWDFGDGNTSTAFEPIHEYLWPDTFTVQLTVFDTASSCSDVTIEQDYIIVQKPTRINSSFIIQDLSINVVPNPFRQSSTISFNLSQAAHVSLEIYNIMGQRAMFLFQDKMFEPQFHEIPISMQHLPDGVYFGSLQVNNQQLLFKLVKVK